jgi:hypothetical protein
MLIFPEIPPVASSNKTRFGDVLWYCASNSRPPPEDCDRKSLTLVDVFVEPGQPVLDDAVTVNVKVHTDFIAIFVLLEDEVLSNSLLKNCFGVRVGFPKQIFCIRYLTNNTPKIKYLKTQIIRPK